MICMHSTPRQVTTRVQAALLDVFIQFRVVKINTLNEEWKLKFQLGSPAQSQNLADRSRLRIQPQHNEASSSFYAHWKYQLPVVGFGRGSFFLFNHINSPVPLLYILLQTILPLHKSYHICSYFPLSVSIVSFPLCICDTHIYTYIWRGEVCESRDLVHPIYLLLTMFFT